MDNVLESKKLKQSFLLFLAIVVISFGVDMAIYIGTFMGTEKSFLELFSKTIIGILFFWGGFMLINYYNGN